MKTTKVYEAAKYTFEANINCGGFCVVMNKASYESLPADIQQVFDELSGESYARMTGKAIDQACIDDLTFMQTEGQQVSTVPADVYASWQKKCEPIVDTWIKAVEKAGHTIGAEMIAQARVLDKEAKQ